MAGCLIDDQLAQVRERIAGLRTLKRQLRALRNQCSTQASVGECCIVQELVAAAHKEGCVCHSAESSKRDGTALVTIGDVATSPGHHQ